jgi:hypothetical protein
LKKCSAISTQAGATDAELAQASPNIEVASIVCMRFDMAVNDCCNVGWVDAIAKQTVDSI